MLRWTSAGAVRMPATVQIRCAAAPTLAVRHVPAARAMTAEEVGGNLRWFAAREGPRQPRCEGAVLSDPPADDDLRRDVALARGMGLRRVVVHADVGAIGVAAFLGADAVAVLFRGPLRHDGAVALTAVVRLDAEGLADLAGTAEALVRSAPARVIFSWPTPVATDEAPPTWTLVGEALRRAGPVLDAAGLPWGVKGLPACALRDAGVDGARARAWRTGNRFVVDADHQRDAALLWMPDVVVSAHRESCRRCALAPACDGVPAAWLDRGLAGPLRPFDEGAHAAS
jgi:hypothetical protein